MKLVLIKSFGSPDVQSHFGGVIDSKDIIAECRNGFKMQVPYSNILITEEITKDHNIQNWNDADAYFKTKYAEYFV